MHVLQNTSTPFMPGTPAGDALIPWTLPSDSDGGALSTIEMPISGDTVPAAIAGRANGTRPESGGDLAIR